MKFIGITGGVGAGKSAILQYISDHYNSRVLLADEIAHQVMEPGTDCNRKLQTLFPEEGVFLEDGQIDRQAMAAILFSDPSRREALNAIVHPAVKEYVIEQEKLEREKGAIDWLILEAALLIEEQYDEICDELWYIYTSEANRRERLKANRGYSDEKIDQIFRSQLSEDQFRAACREEIDNNHTPEDSFAQIREIFDRR